MGAAAVPLMAIGTIAAGSMTSIMAADAKWAAATAQADALLKESKLVAKSYYEKARYVDLTTRQEMKLYKDNLERIQSAVAAGFGASGAMTSDAAPIIAANARVAEGDLNRIKMQGEYEMNSLYKEGSRIIEIGKNRANAILSGASAEYDAMVVGGVLGSFAQGASMGFSAGNRK